MKEHQRSDISIHPEKKVATNSGRKAFDEFGQIATKTLIVGNLPTNVTVADLNLMFQSFGEILNMKIKYPCFINSVIPFAYIEYTNINSVVKALNSTIPKKHNMVLSFRIRQPSNCLWIYGIDKSLSLSSLINHIDKSKNISGSAINRSTECALLHFHQIENAQLAIQKNYGSSLKNRKLQIDFASIICQQNFYESLKTRNRNSRHKICNQIKEEVNTNNIVSKTIINLKHEPRSYLKTEEINHDNIFYDVSIDENYLHYKHKLKKAIQRSDPPSQKTVNDNYSRLLNMDHVIISPKPTKILVIKNLKTVSTSKVEKMFGFFGKIIKIFYKYYYGTLIQNVIFVEYIDINSVFNAINTMNGEKIDQNYIELDFGVSNVTSILWVGIVEKSIREEDLLNIFQKFGDISQCSIDRLRKRALVHYEKLSYAQAAITETHGCILNGIHIQIDFASEECVKEFYRRLVKPCIIFNPITIDQDHDGTSQSVSNSKSDVNFQLVAVKSHPASQIYNNDKNDPIHSIPLQDSEINCIDAMLELGNDINNGAILKSSSQTQINPISLSSNTLTHYTPESHKSLNKKTLPENNALFEINSTDRSNLTDKYPPESCIPSTSRFLNNEVSFEIDSTDLSNLTDKYSPESHINSKTQYSVNNMSFEINSTNCSNLTDKYPPESCTSSTSRFLNNEVSFEIDPTDLSNLTDKYSPESHINSKTQYSVNNMSFEINSTDHSNLTDKHSSSSLSNFVYEDTQDNRASASGRLNEMVDKNEFQTSTLIPYTLSRFKEKFKNIEDLIFKPSYLVNSVLDKPSVFTADTKRLERIFNGCNHSASLESYRSNWKNNVEKFVHKSISSFSMIDLQKLLLENHSYSVSIGVHNNISSEPWNEPRTLNGETIIQEPLLIPSDLSKPKITKKNTSSIADNYVPNNTKDLNIPTCTNVKDRPKNKNKVNQKTETKNIKNVNHKMYFTKSSINRLEATQNEKSTKKKSIELNCSKVIKEKYCKRTNNIESESKECKQSLGQLVEFNMFEVKQVHNYKKQNLINEKNCIIQKKNELKLKKKIVANSNGEVKESNKKCDVVKVKDNFNEEYLHKKMRLKKNMDNNAKNIEHTRKNVEKKKNIDSNEKFIDDKEQKKNERVKEKSIDSEISSINILKRKTNDTSIDCGNSKKSKTNKTENIKKKTCINDTSLIPKLSSDEIIEKQKTDNRKNVTELKRKGMNKFKTLDPMGTKKLVTNQSVNDVFRPYVSMYDTVKARSTKNVQKKEEECLIKVSKKRGKSKQKIKNKINNALVTLAKPKDDKCSDRCLRSHSRKN